MFRPSGMKQASMLTPAPQRTVSIPIPAPNSGINRLDGLADMGPADSVQQFNLIPGQYGTRVRTGYREYCTNVGTSVRTIIPYTGSVEAENALFAATPAGIYDVSSSGAAPVLTHAFGTTTGDAGWGIWTNYTTIGGSFALYCDEVNGYMHYDETTGLWTDGGVTGVTNSQLVFVMIFKSRLWFIQRDTGDAWYLPVGSITGAATKFSFGNKFKHGGTLQALYNWTVDGGEGIDDYLVAISSGGDVVVYKGTDPATATDWFQHGTWFIGPPPVGRRIGGSFGGELYLLSSYGVLPLSKLLSGTLVQQDDILLSKRITPLINAEMVLTRQTRGWEIRLVPTETLLLVSAPKQASQPNIQFVQSLNTQGWAVYRDVPYLTGDSWEGNFYIGDDDGRVLVHAGDLDDVSLAEDTSVQIEWALNMAFQDPGPFGTFKRIQLIRPIFFAEQAPSYNVEARYDYNLSEAMGAIDAPDPSGAVWDVAIWDVSLWGGEFIVVQDLRGGSGMGRAISVALNGRSGSKTILIKFEVMYDTGGLL